MVGFVPLPTLRLLNPFLYTILVVDEYRREIDAEVIDNENKMHNNNK
jgi:hypothetical protein